MTSVSGEVDFPYVSIPVTTENRVPWQQLGSRGTKYWGGRTKVRLRVTFTFRAGED